MNIVKNMVCVAVVMLGFGWSLNASAGVPGTMTYHGVLHDSGGEPVHTTVEATFHIFDAATGGTQAWTESISTIDVNNGSFSVQLGANSPLTGVFDGSAYWLEVSIDGEKLSPRTMIESVPYALRAGSADDASKLGGKTSAEIIASAQAGGAGSAADIAYDNGASGLSASNIQAALDELAALRARVAALETTSGNHATTIAANTGKIATNVTNISANAAGISTNAGKIATNVTNISANAAGISTNAGKIATNTAKVGGLETLTQDMKREVVNGKMSVTFTGVNVHVRSGTGTTAGAINGLGNLIVGYDEVRSVGSSKTGSHNLVVGPHHNYASYGGFVAGRNNTITGSYATICGGINNEASGSESTVSGGGLNIASGQGASISGGVENKATAMFSSVGGGLRNTASGAYSRVSGGKSRVVTGGTSWRAGSLLEAQ